MSLRLGQAGARLAADSATAGRDEVLGGRDLAACRKQGLLERRARPLDSLLLVTDALQRPVQTTAGLLDPANGSERVVPPTGDLLLHADDGRLRGRDMTGQIGDLPARQQRLGLGQVLRGLRDPPLNAGRGLVEAGGETVHGFEQLSRLPGGFLRSPYRDRRIGGVAVLEVLPGPGDRRSYECQ